jgi:hypothetical protein
LIINAPPAASDTVYQQQTAREMVARTSEPRALDAGSCGCCARREQQPRQDERKRPLGSTSSVHVAKRDRVVSGQEAPGRRFRQALQKAVAIGACSPLRRELPNRHGRDLIPWRSLRRCRRTAPDKLACASNPGSVTVIGTSTGAGRRLRPGTRREQLRRGDRGGAGRGR